MAHPFCPGYGDEPFRSLVRDYPGTKTYPSKDFRTEWGPIFHRGRLDGSARVLLLGQDPGQHEAIARRNLVGEAGQRTQGFLTKLGMDSSYVMINTFLYSVYGQGGGERHAKDPKIEAYRNLWLDALLVGSKVEIVVALGHLAEKAFDAWTKTATGKNTTVAFKRITHPTQPDSASKGDPEKRAIAMKEMLKGWNAALKELRPKLKNPDAERPLKPYGDDLTEDDYTPIPEGDLPAGLPAWMRSLEQWAVRAGKDSAEKRATIVVTVPKSV